jgi:hypothetical protein
MELWTNNSEKVSITSGGDVGIGTAAPSEKLHVTGNARVTGAYYDSNNSPGTADQVLVSTVTGTDWQDLSASGVDGTGTANKIAMWSDTDTITDGPITISQFIGQFTSTFTNHLKLNDNGQLRIGSINDLVIVHESNNNSYIQNATGDLYIRNFADDKDIIFQCDNGSGSALTYFKLDGSMSDPSNVYTVFPDNSIAGFGSSANLKIYYSSSKAYLDTTSNVDLVIPNAKVGIGTTSPSSKLHVKDTSLSGTLAYFEASASAMGSTNVRVDCLQYGTGISFFRDGSVGSGACSFRNDSGTQVGSIAIGTSSTSYNTSSDYRLKENLTSITDGIDRLKQLKPKRFNFIGETQIVDGFVAHEAKEVVPESVTGEKDEVLQNGDPVYQGIDQAKLVPLLTAALQEAVAKIENLENRIQTLENK